MNEKSLKKRAQARRAAATLENYRKKKALEKLEGKNAQETQQPENRSAIKLETSEMATRKSKRLEEKRIKDDQEQTSVAAAVHDRSCKRKASTSESSPQKKEDSKNLEVRKSVEDLRPLIPKTSNVPHGGSPKKSKAEKPAKSQQAVKELPKERRSICLSVLQQLRLIAEYDSSETTKQLADKYQIPESIIAFVIDNSEAICKQNKYGPDRVRGRVRCSIPLTIFNMLMWRMYCDCRERGIRLTPDMFQQQVRESAKKIGFGTINAIKWFEDFIKRHGLFLDSFQRSTPVTSNGKEFPSGTSKRMRIEPSGNHPSKVIAHKAAAPSSSSTNDIIDISAYNDRCTSTTDDLLESIKREIRSRSDILERLKREINSRGATGEKAPKPRRTQEMQGSSKFGDEAGDERQPGQSFASNGPLEELKCGERYFEGMKLPPGVFHAAELMGDIDDSLALQASTSAYDEVVEGSYVQDFNTSGDQDDKEVVQALQFQQRLSPEVLEVHDGTF